MPLDVIKRGWDSNTDGGQNKFVYHDGDVVFDNDEEAEDSKFVYEDGDVDFAQDRSFSQPLVQILDIPWDRPEFAFDAEWDESEHPRDHGRFVKKGEGESGGKKYTATPFAVKLMKPHGFSKNAAGTVFTHPEGHKVEFHPPKKETDTNTYHFTFTHGKTGLTTKGYGGKVLQAALSTMGEAAPSPSWSSLFPPETALSTEPLAPAKPPPAAKGVEQFQSTMQDMGATKLAFPFNTKKEKYKLKTGETVYFYPDGGFAMYKDGNSVGSGKGIYAFNLQHEALHPKKEERDQEIAKLPISEHHQLVQSLGGKVENDNVNDTTYAMPLGTYVTINKNPGSSGVNWSLHLKGGALITNGTSAKELKKQYYEAGAQGKKQPYQEGQDIHVILMSQLDAETTPTDVDIQDYHLKTGETVVLNKDTGKFKIWQKTGQGAQSKEVGSGTTAKEFNDAFEKLHPRGAGGKFIAKPKLTNGGQYDEAPTKEDIQKVKDWMSANGWGETTNPQSDASGVYTFQDDEGNTASFGKSGGWDVGEEFDVGLNDFMGAVEKVNKQSGTVEEIAAAQAEEEAEAEAAAETDWSSQGSASVVEKQDWLKDNGFEVDDDAFWKSGKHIWIAPNGDKVDIDPDTGDWMLTQKDGHTDTGISLTTLQIALGKTTTKPTPKVLPIVQQKHDWLQENGFNLDDAKSDDDTNVWTDDYGNLVEINTHNGAWLLKDEAGKSIDAGLVLGSLKEALKGKTPALEAEIAAAAAPVDDYLMNLGFGSYENSPDSTSYEGGDNELIVVNKDGSFTYLKKGKGGYKFGSGIEELKATMGGGAPEPKEQDTAQLKAKIATEMLNGLEDHGFKEVGSSPEGSVLYKNPFTGFSVKLTPESKVKPLPWVLYDPNGTQLTTGKDAFALATAVDFAKASSKHAQATVPVPKSDKTEHYTKTAGNLAELNGIPFKVWKPPADWSTVSGTMPDLVEPPMDAHGKKISAGLLIQEPDGRVWIVKPKNTAYGVEYTFPKGGQEPGMTLQQTAIKEGWEESGLKADIVGYAGDYEGETSMTRYYLAKRVDGSPVGFGWESEGVSLVPPEKLNDFLNKSRDKTIATNHFSTGGTSATGVSQAKLKSSVGGPIDVSKMKQVGGQLGSNKGGQFEDEEGNKYYAKFSPTPSHAKNELLAAQLYKLAGAPILSYHPMPDDKGIVTDWQAHNNKGVKGMSTGEKQNASQWFAVHAWLANWDAAGLGGDNQQMIDGVPTTVDVGGSLLYRAQGGPKGNAFGNEVTEWDTLRDPTKNPDSAELFSGMNKKALELSVGKIAKITDTQIMQMVADHGPGNLQERTALAQKLIQRRDDLIEKATGVIAPHKLLDRSTVGEKLYSSLLQSAKTPNQQQISGIVRYTGGAYQTINKAMRDGLPVPEQYVTDVMHLNHWLAQQSFPGDENGNAVTVTHWVSDDYAKKLQAQLKVGTVFRDDGFTSTDHWKGSLTVKIKLPKNAKAAAVRSWSANKPEDEIIIKPGSKYIVEGLGKNASGKTFVIARYLFEDEMDWHKI